MKKTTMMTLVAAILAGRAFAVQAAMGNAVAAVDRLGKAAAAKDPEAAMNCLYDAHCAGGGVPANPVAAPQGGEASQPVRGPLTLGAPSTARSVPAPSVEGRGEEQVPSGVWAGVKNGARNGAILGFYGVLSPAIHLLGESFGRRMSGYYDGPRKDNSHPGLYAAAGWVLAAVLYIPAMVAGAVGGAIGAVVGAVAEAGGPGSTSHWDAESSIID